MSRNKNYSIKQHPCSGKTPEGGIRKQNIFKKSTRHMPLLTVVTPVLNGLKYIEQTIQSVITQSYDNVEYIVIDGGSTDGTLDILKKYDNQIDYWVSEKDKGLYHALAKGFSHAGGDILSWINSDDIYHPHAFEKVAESMYTRGYQWITGIPTWISGTSTIPRSGYLKVYPRPIIKAGYAHDEGWGFIQQESTFFTKKLYEQAGGIDKNLKIAADFLLWKKMAHYSKLTSINYALAAFRKHDNQLSGDLTAYYAELYQHGGKKLNILRWLRKLSTIFLIVTGCNKLYAVNSRIIEKKK